MTGTSRQPGRPKIATKKKEKIGILRQILESMSRSPVEKRSDDHQTTIDVLSEYFNSERKKRREKEKERRLRILQRESLPSAPIKVDENGKPIKVRGKHLERD